MRTDGNGKRKAPGEIVALCRGLSGRSSDETRVGLGHRGPETPWTTTTWNRTSERSTRPASAGALTCCGPPAKRTIAAGGGDSVNDPLPNADVITMGMILHDWNLEKKMHLIRSAHAALPEGGALAAIENLIDDERRENVFGLLMSLNTSIEFGDAFDFTGADFPGLVQEGRLPPVRRFAPGGPL